MTVERIVGAALDIIDREGLDALSMRSLATQLETGTATLYRYVSSKDEVLVEALDAVLGEIHLPEGFSDASDWRSQVAKAATALRVGLLAHPNITPLLAGSVPIGPNALAGREANLDLLIKAGFAPSTAARLHLTIVHYVIGFVLAERPESAAYGTEYKRTLKRYYQRLPADRYPSIAALADELTTRDIDREFAFGLGLILDGIERQAAINHPARRRRSR
jgi:AcrR family transcriptional regulator